VGAQRTIGGMPSAIFRVFSLIVALGFIAALLSGCSSAPTEAPADQSPDSSQAEPTEGETSTYVEVPGSSRRGDVFDFSYTTEGGTELTCVVYDRDSYKAGAGGLFCFEEDPDGGGMVAPLNRPLR